MVDVSRCMTALVTEVTDPGGVDGVSTSSGMAYASAT